uniref:Uncharacterized protein n=1 Tax=Trichobilharzia regenti TaxID=157069 RepID=A0AA85K9J4_TRIRE|nr:unnamed protein product [Trichobilharzia regenti]
MKFFTWAYFVEVFMGLDTPLDGGKPIRGGFYKTSQTFSPLAEFMHVPLDQINYVVSGVVSFALGQLMRQYLSPQKCSPRLRALIETIFGLLLLSFCFGSQLRVLLLQSFIAYVFMVCLPHNQFMAILVTVWSLFYMTLVHICRLQYDYGGYTLDISGPVMVQTQRLSSLAFNLVDGAIISSHEKHTTTTTTTHPVKHQQNNSSNDSSSSSSPPPKSPIIDQSQSHSSSSSLSNRRRNTFTTLDTLDMPSSSNIDLKPIHHHHYHTPSHCKLLNEQKPFKDSQHSSSLTASSSGQQQQMPTSHKIHAVDKTPDPVIFFAYMLYFHGVCVGPFIFFSEYMEYLKGYSTGRLPSINMYYLVTLCLRTLASGLSAAYLCPYFPFDFVLTEAFGSYSLLHRIFYVTVSLFLIRQKYYFAWGLAEVNGVAIGVGYTGQCPRTGRTLNHHVRNFNFIQVESGIGLKDVVDAWNISTTRWLRETFYDRLPTAYRTILVFIISAFWHGFYPGYYIMFLSFALFTTVSRIWRRHCRVYFRKTPLCIHAYDIFTMIITNFIINYGQAPFHLLDFYASIKFLSLFYFIPHLIAFIILIAYFFKSYFIKSIGRGGKVDEDGSVTGTATGIGIDNGDGSDKHQKLLLSNHDRSVGGY